MCLHTEIKWDSGVKVFMSAIVSGLCWRSENALLYYQVVQGTLKVTSVVRYRDTTGEGSDSLVVRETSVLETITDLGRRNVVSRPLSRLL